MEGRGKGGGGGIPVGFRHKKQGVGWGGRRVGCGPEVGRCSARSSNARYAHHLQGDTASRHGAVAAKMIRVRDPRRVEQGERRGGSARALRGRKSTGPALPLHPISPPPRPPSPPPPYAKAIVQGAW